jgi:hypothetical protein
VSQVRVAREVSLAEAAERLRERVGPSYQVGELTGAQSGLMVRRNAVIRSPVRVSWDGGATTFDVRAGGVGILFRVVNSLGIARRVQQALAEAFAEAPAQ